MDELDLACRVLTQRRNEAGQSWLKKKNGPRIPVSSIERNASRTTSLADASGVQTFRFDAAPLQQLQACLASYLGHFKPAACHRLVQGVWQANPWLRQFFQIDPNASKLRARVKAPTKARTVLAQYQHWKLEFPDDEVWIQVERLSNACNGRRAVSERAPDQLRWGWREAHARNAE